ncbi:minor capsid protein [Anoxybacillus sp. UARK-01]|uniref:minor capsid protein n=1 Tax=Anoxybacillus sp. UARK-01 TaxID=1895648 RepID=UPI0009BB217B|nr:minor capsid protein [Anoxybacillus sp. UARK-01]OQM47533.1 minor capsid protein [Anoxybacillus sp. UARK-01]
MIKLDVKVNINQNQLQSDIDRRLDKAQYALDNQVLRDSNYFIPKDTGNLEKSSFLHSQIGQGKIVWNTPYARRLYYNPQYNFSKDVNPNAQGLWFEVAKARWYNEWVQVAQNAYDKG